MMLLFRIIFLIVFVFYYSSINVWSSEINISGLSCIKLKKWSNIEKKILKETIKKTVNGEVVKNYFIEPTKVFLSKKKSKNCIYKSTSLKVLFKENNKFGGGEIYIHFPLRLHKKKLISSMYLLYLFNEKNIGDADNGELKEMFMFNSSYRLNSYNFAPSFKHSKFLYPKIYWIVAIFTYEDDLKILYAMKIKPKGIR